MSDDNLNHKHSRINASIDIHTSPQENIRDWRSAVLNRLLPIIAVTILPALIKIVLEAVYNPSISKVGVILLVLLYSALIFITLAHGLGPKRRSWGLMILIYLVGLVALARGGLAGDGRIYLVTLTVMAVILVDIRAGLFFASLSLATYAGFSFLANAGILNSWLVYKTNPLSLGDWLLNGLTLATMIGIMLYISYRSSAFQMQALNTTQKTADALVEANLKLEQLNLSLEHTVEQRTAELREANEHLTFLVMHDTLTGLPNRVLLYDRLQQAILLSQWKASRFALLFVDLDNFKIINDTYGHETGDQLLVKVGAVLQQSIRESDTAARLGGDEFVIILNEVHSLQNVERVARLLLDVFSQPLRVGEVDIQISASIGASLYPDDGSDPETLLQKADKAMYSVKGAQKNNFMFFTLDVRSNNENQPAGS